MVALVLLPTWEYVSIVVSSLIKIGVEYTEFKEPDLDFKVTALAVFGHEELFKRLKVVTED